MPAKRHSQLVFREGVTFSTAKRTIARDLHFPSNSLCRRKINIEVGTGTAGPLILPAARRPLFSFFSGKRFAPG